MKAKLYVVQPGPSINIDDVMGEEIRAGDPGKVATLDPKQAQSLRRRRNYHLLRRARHMFMGHQTPKGHDWRVCECRRHVAKGRGGVEGRGVEIWKDQGSGTASYRKLAACGSVWTCAVCSAKIAQVRRHEVQEAAVRSVGLGWSFCMVTLTVRHGAGDQLAPMLEKMSAALKLMRNNRGTVTLRDSWEFKGLIRALEVTYGEANGWHPHFHELHFFQEAMTPERCDQYRDAIATAWVRACQTVGLPAPDYRIGVDVMHVDPKSDAEAAKAAAAYAAKAFSAELVYGMRKQARAGRYSVWELLEGNRLSLFREYAEAFHGRRQLLWSPGLKKALTIAELSDQDAAGDAVEVEGEKADQLVLTIPAGDWPKVRGLPGDGRVYLLELLEENNYGEVESFLRGLGVRPLWGKHGVPWAKWWNPRHLPESGLTAA